MKPKRKPKTNYWDPAKFPFPPIPQPSDEKDLSAEETAKWEHRTASLNVRMARTAIHSTNPSPDTTQTPKTPPAQS